jgi:hypothetical protein
MNTYYICVFVVDPIHVEMTFAIGSAFKKTRPRKSSKIEFESVSGLGIDVFVEWSSIGL